MRKLDKRHRIGSGVLFFIYLVLLMYFMFFAESLGRDTVSLEYHYNLVPFKEITRFLTYWRKLGIGAVAANLLGNVVAFVPFGLFLPGLVNNRYGYIGMTILSLDMSLVIELSQLISKVGSFDVDDLILNTIGGFIGYCIFRQIFKNRKGNVTEHGESKV